MSVVVRFVQRVRPADMEAYLAVERSFVAWESQQGKVDGRRLRSFAGAEPVDTLVWEGEYPTRAAAAAAIDEMEADARHRELWSEQVRYVVDRRVELFDVLDLQTDGPGS
jgi:hypothetical protein